MTLRLARLMVLCTAALALAAPSSAQVFTGRIDVTVTDTTGAILPNVTVTLSGPSDKTAVSDAQGEVHFVGLAPGTYTVRARLEGFNEYTNKDVPVVAGGVVPLKVALSVGGVATQVDVTAASPVIDPKKLASATNVTLEQLQNVPSSRDPWVVLQTVPGVIVDRVNVGGAESGQQSNYMAKGAGTGDNTWNMDGVAITDMAALGSSPTYYDFDMFQEMQVTTGGVDLTNATPGVALNFVLKGGSNTPHGSTRIYYEDEGMQSTNLPDDLVPLLGGATKKGNRINTYKDYGFELGGPIFKDRLWGWGSIGKTDVTLITLTGTPDQTILKNRALKLNGQATNNLRGSYTYFLGDKNKYGRNAGPTRPPETTWNQKGPSPVHKVEGNLVLGQNLFLTGRWSYVGGGFSLTPQGGLSTPYYWDDAGIARGSYYHYETTRPQHAVAAEGNYFRGKHEIKFGFGWRKADVDSTSIVPGSGIVTYHDGYPNMFAEVTVWNDNTSAKGVYQHAYVGDTIAMDRLTFTAGVRWDRQTGSVNVLTQKGNPAAGSLLPDLTGEAANNVIVWNSFVPRVGLSYALDSQRKTLLRASYGMFASQLNATAGNFMSTVQYRGVYFYGVTDTNGNRVVDPSEIAGRTCNDALVEAGECNYYGINDINSPGAVAKPIHKVGDYSTPMTHEVQFGVDRELMPNFGVNATFTWRRFGDFVRRDNGLRAGDYQQLGTFTFSNPTVGNVSVPFYGVIPGHAPANRSATTYVKREGYHQRYLGFEVSATKRLSNRWMARFGFSTNDHREYFDSLEGHAPGDLTPTQTNPQEDGGLVVRQSTGSGKSGIWQVLPSYQFIATGLYEARWGFKLGANVVNRQGFAAMYAHSRVPTGDPLGNLKTVLLAPAGDFRLPAVTSFDFRVGKEFAFNRYRFNLDLDIFNLFNASTVLQRVYDLRLPTANNVQEIMNPRVLRLGARFNF